MWRPLRTFRVIVSKPQAGFESAVPLWQDNSLNCAVPNPHFHTYWLSGLNSAQWIELVGAECKLPLGPTRVLSIASRANVKSLHALWPIRMPRPSCANQNTWAVLTPRRPKANFYKLYTRTPHTTSRSRLCHFQYKFSSPLFVLGQRAVLSLGSITSHFKLVQTLTGACWRNPDKIWTACMPQAFSWIIPLNISKPWRVKRPIQNRSYSTLLF